MPIHRLSPSVEIHHFLSVRNVATQFNGERLITYAGEKPAPRLANPIYDDPYAAHGSSVKLELQLITLVASINHVYSVEPYKRFKHIHSFIIFQRRFDRFLHPRTRAYLSVVFRVSEHEGNPSNIECDVEWLIYAIVGYPVRMKSKRWGRRWRNLFLAKFVEDIILNTDSGMF